MARLRSPRDRAPVLLVIPAVAAAVVALLPLWYLLDQAASQGFGAVWDEIVQDRTLWLVLRSLGLTAVVTTGCVVIGVIAAVLVVKTSLPGRRIWHVALTVPLAIPSYVAAYTWVSWRPEIAGFGGAALVLTLGSFPYVYLPVASALSRLDPATEEVATSLGLAPWRVLVAVSVRQVRPAIGAGALLVALYVLSDFGAVGTMRYEAFSWVIYGAFRSGFNPARAAILACVLVAVAAVFVAAESRLRGRPSFTRLGAGAPRPQRAVALGRATPVALGFTTAVLALALGFPVVNLAIWFNRGLSADFDLGAIGSALGDTLLLSAAGALLTMALAIPVGALAARRRGPLVQLVERATYIGHGLPAIVIALSMVFVGVNLLEPIYQRTPLVALAYAVLFLPLGVGAVRGAVEQSPVVLEEVGRSLGYSPMAVLRRITLRLAAPGVAAGTALVMLTAVKELPATLLLHPTGSETLAMGLWSNTNIGRYAAAAPYAATLVLLASVPTLVLTRMGRTLAPDDAGGLTP